MGLFRRIQQTLADPNLAFLFLSIGTSGVVYPAAGFVRAVRARGLAHTVELNLEPSAGHSLFAESLYGPASTVVPRFVRRLIEDGR